MLATLRWTPADLRAIHPPKAVLVRSVDELRDALRAARERALALDLSALNRMLRLDRRRKLLELQAATSWASLAGYLAEHYSASQAAILAETASACIGESLARNDAGPDGTPLSAHVEAITLFTADGELRRADRQTNSALFRLALGGHGLIGVLYSVTLRVDSLLQAATAAEPPISIDLMQPQRATRLRQVDFLVPPESLDATLTALKALAYEHRIELQRIAVRRLRAESETVLRWASREWAGVSLRYAPRATLGACVYANEIERQFLECVLRHGGSFSLGAPHLPTLAQLETCYPMLREFLSAKRRLDPESRLQTPWFRWFNAMLCAEWPAAQARAGAE